MSYNINTDAKTIAGDSPVGHPDTVYGHQQKLSIYTMMCYSCDLRLLFYICCPVVLLSPWLCFRIYQMDVRSPKPSTMVLSYRVKFDINTSLSKDHPNLANHSGQSSEPSTKNDKTVNDETTNIGCQERRHLVLLKVPKAGSSTVQNIFYRFGTTRNLTFALPRHGDSISYHPYINKDKLIPPPAGRRYEILCNHVPYNRTAFEEIIPSDSVYAGIVRHPVSHLTSYLQYFYRVMDEKDKFQDFILNVEKYRGLPRNPMAEYFGLPPQDGKDMTRIFKFLHQIDREFDIVLVLEQFDESLVLMKRRLCWSFADIVYVATNANPNYTKFERNEWETNIHQTIAVADYVLYGWFRQKLNREILNGGEDFIEELAAFRKVLLAVQTFCLGTIEENDSHQYLYVAASSWSPAFNMTSSMCYMMTMRSILKLQDYIGERQYGQIWKTIF